MVFGGAAGSTCSSYEDPATEPRNRPLVQKYESDDGFIQVFAPVRQHNASRSSSIDSLPKSLLQTTDPYKRKSPFRNVVDTEEIIENMKNVMDKQQEQLKMWKV